MATVDVLDNIFLDDRPRQVMGSGHACINWTFTLNNYRQEDFTALDELFLSGKFKYMIYGKEICPTTGTPHLQGFLQMAKKIRFRGLKQLLGDKYHLEQAEHPWFAAEYCKKDGEWNEFGKFVAQVCSQYE